VGPAPNAFALLIATIVGCVRSLDTAQSNAVTETEELKSLQNRALGSLGRNVLHFHRLEFRLKLLLLLSDYEGPPGKFAESLKTRFRKLRKSPLGALAEEWNANFSQPNVPPEFANPLPESYMAVRFFAETTPENAKAMKRQLRSLVAERNRLIHHDLATFDPTSAESRRKLIALLDEQNKRILPQIKALDQLHSATVAGLQALFASLVLNPAFMSFATPELPREGSPAPPERNPSLPG